MVEQLTFSSCDFLYAVFLVLLNQTGADSAPSFLHLALSPFFLLLPCMCLVVVCPSPAPPIFPVWPLSSWNGLNVDISISLLAVVVGFCGLALLAVSLFVFWKLCWPIWRSKALPAHCENGLHVGFDVPPPRSPPITEYKAAELEKKKPLEVKVNGRSSVKILEAAMKISQTSPDIPAEVQTALRERISPQPPRIQRQTTEPTSSSRYPLNLEQAPPKHWAHAVTGRHPIESSFEILLWFVFSIHATTTSRCFHRVQNVLRVCDSVATVLEEVWNVSPISSEADWPWKASAHKKYLCQIVLLHFPNPIITYTRL